jgi:GntR family transcriptional repressor for pyruvate dehydrogenase complex
MIEPQCVRLAAIRGTEADFDRVEQLLDAHDAAYRKGRSVNQFRAKFHVMLAEASHNKVAVSFMTSILGILMQRGQQVDHIPDYQERAIKEHREILAVVRAREPDRAADMMFRHIVESAMTYGTGDLADNEASSPKGGAPRHLSSAAGNGHTGGTAGIKC